VKITAPFSGDLLGEEEKFLEKKGSFAPHEKYLIDNRIMTEDDDREIKKSSQEKSPRLP